jgi:NAD(P)-dependent dehydrogenase (short-subunit alcohol dehydrogenase family)
MTSSTEKGGAEAVAAIKARAGETAEAVWFGADLCDLKATRAAIDKLVAEEDRLDLVVLDAGFMRSHDTTADGIEHTFVVNWLSNVLFVNRLLPLLRKTAGRANGGARIVVVSSEHHRFCPSAMHFGSLEEINDPSLTPSQIYGRTKVRSALGLRARAAPGADGDSTCAPFRHRPLRSLGSWPRVLLLSRLVLPTQTTYSCAAPCDTPLQRQVRLLREGHRQAQRQHPDRRRAPG